MNSKAFHTELEQRGFAIVPQLFDAARLHQLGDAINAVPSGVTVSARAGQRFGIRNLLSCVPSLAELLAEPAVRAIVESIVGPDARVTRSIFYDKPLRANWQVGWHQDTTIAVCARHEVPGFHGWSVKAGVVHTQPPAEVLARVLTMRIHLDAADEHNGALLVLPGSHRHGLLSEAAADEWVRRHEAVLCRVPVGGVLLMRPLLLHASAKSLQSTARRIVHLEWAGGALPGGLEWNAT